MKKLNRKPRAIVIPASGVPALERKLVLKRLKPPPQWRLWRHRGQHWGQHWKSAVKVLGRLLPSLLSAVFLKAEIVREVGPGLPPQREHEWKEARQREMRI